MAENFRDPPKYSSWYFWKVPFYGDVEVPEWFYRAGRVVNLASLAPPPILWIAVAVASRPRMEPRSDRGR